MRQERGRPPPPCPWSVREAVATSETCTASRHEPRLCAHRAGGKSRGRGGVTTTLRLYRYHGAFVRCACGLCGVPSPLRLRPTHMIILLRHSAFSITMEDYQSCHMLLNAQWKRCTCTPPHKQRSHETDEKAFFPGAFPAATLLQRGRSSTTRQGQGLTHT